MHYSVLTAEWVFTLTQPSFLFGTKPWKGENHLLVLGGSSTVGERIGQIIQLAEEKVIAGPGATIEGSVPKEFVNFNIAAHFSTEREDIQRLDLSVA